MDGLAAELSVKDNFLDDVDSPLEQRVEWQTRPLARSLRREYFLPAKSHQHSGKSHSSASSPGIIHRKLSESASLDLLGSRIR